MCAKCIKPLSNKSLCMKTVYKYFNSNYKWDVWVLQCLHAVFVQCYFASSISPCLSFLRSSLTVCAHAPLCLGCERAFEYLMAFLSHSRVAELTAKLRRHNYLLSTADLLVKQLLRKRHRMRRPSSGQLCILRSCLLSLAREFRDRQLLGGGERAGDEASRCCRQPGPGFFVLGTEECFFFCWGQRETMSCSRGKIDILSTNHCCCLWVFFLSVIFVLFFLAHPCSIYWPLHRVLDE